MILLNGHRGRWLQSVAGQIAQHSLLPSTDAPPAHLQLSPTSDKWILVQFLAFLKAWNQIMILFIK